MSQTLQNIFFFFNAKATTLFFFFFLLNAKATTHLCTNFTNSYNNECGWCYIKDMVNKFLNYILVMFII